MDKVLAALVILVLAYGIYNANYHDKKQTTTTAENCAVCQIETDKLSGLKQELKNLENPSYIKQYIIDVIDHGSYDLGFKGGVMEGGFASHEDAKKIACYVLSLSGKKCSHPYEKDAQMFFTSICGGCHGNDGKGLADGNYPDLTRKKLLGLQKREAALKATIAKLEKQKKHH